MKTIISFLIFAVASNVVMAKPTYEQSIRAAQSEPGAATVMELSGHLRGIARYNQPPENNLYYKTIQQTLLAIPGHAQYLADEIERLRREGKYLATARHQYIVEVMANLPSPETLWVLGRYLNDERDTPPPPVPYQDWTALPANCFLAVDALGKIGLRNAPPTKLYIFNDREVLDTNREWWEEVKAGSKTFSFKGAAVEYIFKPDGTWDTIPIANPPDDGLKPVPATAIDRPVKRSGDDRDKPVESPDVQAWWWVGIGGTALLALGAWFRRKKTDG